VSSTPRSSGSSRSVGRSPLTGVTVNQKAVLANLSNAQNAKRGPGPAFTPIGAVLRAVNIPNMAIGDAIRNPSHIIRGGPSFADLYSGRKGVSIGNALEERGALDVIPDKYGMRSVAKLVADIGLDPTTYITFGGGAAVKAASKAGSANLLGAAAAKKGARVSIADVAQSAAVREAALAASPRKLSIGFRIPLTRGKTIPIVESRKAAAAGERVAGAIGNTRPGTALREVFFPAGSASKAAHRIGSDARRFGESEKRLITKEAVAFQKSLETTAKAAGLSTDDAYRSIVRSLDQPDKYKVPDALAGMRSEAADMFDTFRVLEDSAGVDRGLVDSYVPHLPGDGRTRKEFERMFPMEAPSKEFFQKPRDLQTLDQWDELGLIPEYNLARLLEVRGHASVDSRVLKAFDDAVKDVPGIGTADVIRVKDQIRPMMTGNNAIRDATQFVNTLGSTWKALALLSPGYHMRNFQSDAISAWWAGARNPASFSKAVNLLRGKGSITIDGVTYSAREFIDLAEASGAIRLGQAGKEIRAAKYAEGGVKRRRRGLSRPGHGKLASGSEAIGAAREDFMRLGVFIERLKAGDDLMAAGKVTRDYLFDYGDVGKFVAGARRFWLPFITFSSKAVPMVGRQVATRPGTLATLAKVNAALNESAGSPDLSLLSQGARSSVAVPVPDAIRKLIGAPPDQAMLFNPESVQAYGSLNSADPTNLLRSFGGFLNPIPKSLIEGKTGYSFYFDGPGGKTVGAPAVVNAANALGVPVLGHRTKTDKYTGDTYPAFSRNLDLAFRVLPLYGQTGPLIPGGRSDATRLPYLKWLFGLSVTPYDRAKDAYYAEKYGRK